MAQKKKWAEIHRIAKERFKEILDFEGAERIKMEDDKKFSIGENNDQWDDGDVTSRKSSNRSFLTIMRSNQFTDHIKNNARQNKMSIKISPTDEGAQEKVATRRQGLVRHIQYESIASQARQAGFDDAVDEGRGHWIVKTEYVEGTFNQKICVEPIQDSRSVYMDWRRQRPDYSDCKYGFVVTPVAKKTYEEKYPKFAVSNWDAAKSDFWQDAKNVIIAEYYCEMYKTRTLVEVAGVGQEEGQSKILFEDEIKEEISEERIIQKRTVEDPYWMWFKMNGEEIIDDKELPFKLIPICTCIGKENIVDGQWSLKGLLRDIKAPLRLYNFVSSNEADIISKAPRAPWVGAEGQFEGHEQEYANANISDVAYLEYKPVSIGGHPAPPPQRAQYSVDLSNLMMQKQSIIEDIKAITGIYDASIGNRSNETSGVAIRAREKQGDSANFHYDDNLAMAINHEGRVINSALPIIYDMPRTITIMGEDDEEQMEKINYEGDPGLGTGNFNVTVSVGPSFNTQREEEAMGMLEMSSKSAIIQEIGMGKVIRAQDWPGKDGLADLIDKFVIFKYPGLSDLLQKTSEDMQLMMLQQQLQQSQQQMQQLQQQSQQLQEALQKAQADKQAAAAGEIQYKMGSLEIERGKLQLESQKVMAEIGIKQKEMELKQREIEVDVMKNDLDNSTKVKVNTDSLQVEMIKTVQNNDLENKREKAKLAIEQQRVNVETFAKVTDRMSAEQIHKNGKEIEGKKGTTVNILTPKKKQSTITKTADGKYNVETKEI